MISVVPIYGTETKEEMEEIAWQMFAHSHPHEASEAFPERFWDFFQERFPRFSRDEMNQLLRETE